MVVTTLHIAMAAVEGREENMVTNLIWDFAAAMFVHVMSLMHFGKKQIVLGLYDIGLNVVNQRHSIERASPQVCSHLADTFSEDRQNEARHAAIVKLERQETSECILHVHDVEMNEREHTCPTLLVVLDVEMKGLNDSLVSPLACAISLWMIAGGELRFNTGETKKGLPEFKEEQLITVRDNLQEKTILAIPFPEENGGKVLGSNIST